MQTTFSDSNLDLLKKHLQAIVEVEFFTIPLYLTAVYSFTSKALNYSPDGGKTTPLYDLQQNALSVAVQEMYHLQLASNLSNAFDVTPQIPKNLLTVKAGKKVKIPHLEKNGKELTAELGDLPSVIKTMIQIEAPDPNPKFPEPNEKVMYPSISDLYHATLQLLTKYLSATEMIPMSADPNFNPGNKQIGYGTFPSTYEYNEIKTRPLVAKVANAITDQGEGKLVAPNAQANKKRVAAATKMLSLFKFAEDDNVLPEFQPKAGSRFAAYGNLTHFKRFENIKEAIGNVKDWEKKIGGAVFYPDGKPSKDLPAWAAKYKVTAAAVSKIWSYMVDLLINGLQTGNLPGESGKPQVAGFNDTMISFKYTLPFIWQWGYCPSYVYQSGVTPADVQSAMDSIDPLCLFHWDATTAKLRAKPNFPKNACQGLNTCKGFGWGGIATEKGNGACATADLHTCGANNSCKNEGGCGYLVSKGGEACGSSTQAEKPKSSKNSGSPTTELLPPSEEWIPGANICGKMGGCQTPISTGQLFNSKAGQSIEQQPNPPWTDDAKQQFEKLMGTNVWDRARTLFQQTEKLDSLPTPISKKVGDVDYDGTERRKAVPPTST